MSRTMGEASPHTQKCIVDVACFCRWRQSHQELWGAKTSRWLSWMKCELLTPSCHFPILTLQSTEGTWNEGMGWHSCQKACDTANHILQAGWWTLRQLHWMTTVHLYHME